LTNFQATNCERISRAVSLPLQETSPFFQPSAKNKTLRAGGLRHINNAEEVRRFSVESNQTSKNGKPRFNGVLVARIKNTESVRDFSLNFELKYELLSESFKIAHLRA
jgi:hypothetical protein